MNNEIPKLQIETETSLERLSEPVYYVESAEDDTVLVGIDVRIRSGIVEWFDTIKDRSMLVNTILDRSNQHFVFKRSNNEGGGIYTFTPMTLERYEGSVKQKLIDGQTFSDYDDMIKAFLETKNDAW